MISVDTVVTHGDEQVSCEIDGEIVLMSVENGEYHRIDEIGSRLWTHIEEPMSVDNLCERLLGEYEVEREDCQKDVFTFLDMLYNGNLIRLV